MHYRKEIIDQLLKDFNMRFPERDENGNIILDTVSASLKFLVDHYSSPQAAAENKAGESKDAKKPDQVTQGENGVVSAATEGGAPGGPSGVQDQDENEPGAPPIGSSALPARLNSPVFATQSADAKVNPPENKKYNKWEDGINLYHMMSRAFNREPLFCLLAITDPIELSPYFDNSLGPVSFRLGPLVKNQGCSYFGRVDNWEAFIRDCYKAAKLPKEVDTLKIIAAAKFPLKKFEEIVKDVPPALPSALPQAQL